MAINLKSLGGDILQIEVAPYPIALTQNVLQQLKQTVANILNAEGAHIKPFQVKLLRMDYPEFQDAVLQPDETILFIIDEEFVPTPTDMDDKEFEDIIRRSDMNELEQWLMAHPDVNFTFRRAYWTPLLIARHFGKVDVMLALLDHGANAAPFHNEEGVRDPIKDIVERGNVSKFAPVMRKIVEKQPGLLQHAKDVARMWIIYANRKGLNVDEQHQWLEFLGQLQREMQFGRKRMVKRQSKKSTKRKAKKSTKRKAKKSAMGKTKKSAMRKTKKSAMRKVRK